MSVNSSFNSSDSSPHPPILINHCSEVRISILNFTAFTVASILLLPLYILVLYMGYQRWRKQSSVSTAAMASHSDIFTYNVVAMEMISLLGSCFYCSGTLTESQIMVLVAMDMFSVTSPGQTLFHLLTCVERYLAVVHPITYLSLKQSGGGRIRSIATGCVWLACFAFLGGTKVFHKLFPIITACSLLIFSISVVFFCSLSVLCVLIRPGPGDVGGDRERVDQTKRRAFYSIAVIMTALVLRFVGILVSSMTFVSVLTRTSCIVQSSAVWLTVPGSLVLPLLFLHRAGKLPGCRYTTERTA